MKKCWVTEGMGRKMLWNEGLTEKETTGRGDM